MKFNFVVVVVVVHKMKILLTDTNQVIQFHPNHTTLIEETCIGTNN